MDGYVTALVQYNAKTAGRDKINRLFQYGSKLLVDIMKRTGASEEIIDKLNSLISVLGMARVTYRIGMFIDLIQVALKCTKLSDPVLRVLLTLARLCLAGFLYYDMLAWTIKAKLVSGDVTAWSMRSTTFWFWSMIFNMLRDLYECHQQLMLYIKCVSGKINYGPEKGKAFQDYGKKIILDFLKNLSDMFIAGQACGKIPVSQGVVGFCGVVSSLIAIMEITCPTMKL